MTPWTVATRLLHPWDFPGKSTGVGCHFLLQCMKVRSQSEVAQWCPTLSDLMDYSLPGSSVHGILQARILKQFAISSSRGSSQQVDSFFLVATIKIIYCNWRLITSQYCSGFCHTLTWISHGCTCVPHPEPSSHVPPHTIPQGTTHSSILAWKIPWTEEPGGLQSAGSQTAGHNWATE